MSRIRHLIVVLVLALIVLVPTRADALPRKFSGCKQVAKSGITYLLYRDAAIVKSTKTKSVTIPYSIRVSGKKYIVRAVLDGAFTNNRKLRKIDLKARLEFCQDDSLFIRDSRNIRITVHRMSDYNWIKYGESCCNSLVTPCKVNSLEDPMWCTMWDLLSASPFELATLLTVSYVGTESQKREDLSCALLIIVSMLVTQKLVTTVTLTLRALYRMTLVSVRSKTI